MHKMMPGRAVIFITKRADYRGITLYKNTFYEMDEAVVKVFVMNEFGIEPLPGLDKKWSLKQSPQQYLAENPAGPKAMLAKQWLALQRGVNQTPHNYKEAPKEPVIMDETPHEKRAAAKKAAEQAKAKAESEPASDGDEVSE